MLHSTMMQISLFRRGMASLVGMLFTFFAQGQATCAPTPPEANDRHPLRSLRGAWVTSVFNLDWPTNRQASPATQQAELLRILDTLKATGFNTVFLQVRTGCDALYASAYEPWSYYLTGTEGQAPSPAWDPLQFAITAAHARGLELHAWVNPYRARTGSYTLAPQHIMLQQPGWILTIGSNLVLNPGLPAVHQYLTTIMADITSRYAIDGLHFDDYFYPSAITTGLQDAGTYASHNPTGIGNIEDWRRHNVNQLIAMVYDTVQYINRQQQRNVIFGVSPFGIWKSGVPTGISGQSSYSALYCDPIAWMQQGKVDYVAPQLYWRIGGAQDYDRLSRWWHDTAQAYGTRIYTGHAWYKMIDNNNWAAAEIEAQIAINRLPARPNLMGEAGYRSAQLMANSKGLQSALQQDLYRYPAYVPPYPGKDSVCPLPPTRLRIDGDTLRWDPPAPAPDGDLARKYVVYQYPTEADAAAAPYDGTRVLGIVATPGVRLPAIPHQRYVVTALDKNNNESTGALSPLPPVVICPGGSTTLPAQVAGSSFAWQLLQEDTWIPLANDATFGGTTTGLLSITDMPVALHGSQLRCLANGSTPGPVYTLRVGTTWTGAQSTDWHTAANWDCGTVPTAALDAIIPGHAPRQPVVGTAHANARSVELRTHASLTLGTGLLLVVEE